MWPSGGNPLELTEEDVTTMFTHRDWLSTAALMGNEYLSPLDAPFTDANADAYGHRFTLGAEHVSLVKRRRYGQANDAWPIEKVATEMPLSANPSHQFNVDQSLLDVLAGLPARQDELAERILSAIPLFTQANRLSERTPLSFDLVLLGAALERLFEISSPRIGEKLADAVSKLFIGFTHGATTWQNSAVVSGNLTPDQGPFIKRWAREFYSHRSAIHGGTPPHSKDWADLWHALIATEVFTLSVKVLLDAEGWRPMTDEEDLAADALDARIEVLATPGADPASAWRDARLAAERRAIVAAAARDLSRQR